MCCIHLIDYLIIIYVHLGCENNNMTGCMRINGISYRYDQSTEKCETIKIKWGTCEDRNFWPIKEVDECIKECEGAKAFDTFQTKRARKGGIQKL